LVAVQALVVVLALLQLVVLVVAERIQFWLVAWAQ
jgi:hypothetical protein